MRLQASSLWVVGSLVVIACGEPAPEPADVGELCVEISDCRVELVCHQGACADDSGPSVDVLYPDVMTAFDPGDEISMSATMSGPGDSIEFTFDPHGSAPATTKLMALNGAYTGALPGPAEPGAYWLRVRVLDDEGQPYANPSATEYVNVFVRDPIHPDKPLLAILEPRPDRQHRYGEPVEVQVGVLPGSFVFTNIGTTCKSLEGCADPFAPECEAECGPISRFGHAKLYLLDDYPGCLLDFPNCNGDYMTLIRPGAGNQLDAYILTGTLEADQLEVGDMKLSAALSFDYHQPYPTSEAVIHTQQTLTIVDPAP